MVYEVYADLLWTELFFWNLYGLVMTDFRLWNPAGRGRRLLGASAGACCMIAAFWLPGCWLRCVGMIGGSLIMLLLTFRIRRLRVFLMVLRMYVSSLLLLGGVMLAIYRMLFAGLKYGKTPAVLLGGVMVTGGYVLMKRRELRSGRQFEGRAVLKHRGIKVRAMAVIDSGNALTEPFSGEQVCVLLGAEEEELRLDGELYRAVPYQCVGKTKGILKAYRMEKILLDFGGPEKVLQGVYVAFGEPDSEKKGRILLIPPGILQKKGKIAKGLQNCGRIAKLQEDYKIAGGLQNCKRIAMGESGMKKAGKGAKRMKLMCMDRIRWRWLGRDRGCRRWMGGELYYIGGTDILPPPLEPAREVQMIEELETEHCEEAKAALIEHNLRLVVYIAKKFDNTGVGVEDLISIGTIGLIKSINTFQPSKNIKLATYASRCIENEILMYLRRNSKTRLEVSFDEPLNVDWDGNELLLSDILGTEEDIIYRDIENQVDRNLLKKALSKLKDREKLIVSLRYGLGRRDGREMTQKEVAELLGISQSYISRLEKKIIRQLKREMSLSV